MAEERLSKTVMRQLEEILEKKAIQNEFETMVNFLKLRRDFLLRLEAFGANEIIKQRLISGAEFMGWKMCSTSDLRLSEEESQIFIWGVICKKAYDQLKEKQ